MSLAENKLDSLIKKIDDADRRCRHDQAEIMSQIAGLKMDLFKLDTTKESLQKNVLWEMTFPSREAFEPKGRSTGKISYTGRDGDNQIIIQFNPVCNNDSPSERNVMPKSDAINLLNKMKETISLEENKVVGSNNSYYLNSRVMEVFANYLMQTRDDEEIDLDDDNYFTFLSQQAYVRDLNID